MSRKHERPDPLVPLPDSEVIEFFCVEHTCSYRLRPDGEVYRGMLAERLDMRPLENLPKVIRYKWEVERA